jgi:hypothetical protein
MTAHGQEQVATLVPVQAADVLSYEQSTYVKPSKSELSQQVTHSLITAGVHITVRSEGGALRQVLIEIDSNRNGSFDDINDAFFSIDARHGSVVAGKGDEGGIIRSDAVVAGVLGFIARLDMTRPEAFERDMRLLSGYVSQSTDAVIRAVAGAH